MIYLNEVCEKLSEILNSDENPADFLYAVESIGFHSDTLMNGKANRNVIRVFVSSMGGTFNPIFGLGEASYNIPITIYFPVRFKNDIFALDAYLHQVFVGAIVSYGQLSGSALSNLSVSQYGEIMDMEALREFEDWVSKTFVKMPIEVTEPYMSVTMNLYLSTISQNYAYGNEVTATLSWTGHSIPLVFADGSIQSNSQAEQQQQIGQYESDGLPFSTTYGTSFRLYLGKDEASTILFDKWLDGTIFDLDLTLTVTFPSMNRVYQRKVFLASAVLPIQKGQPLTMTMTFSKRYEG